MAVRSHYDTLGVGKDASEPEIKAAVRRKRSKAHPDREGGDADEMQAVNEAARVLLLPHLRERYDKTGEDAKPLPPVDDRARHVILTIVNKLLDQILTLPHDDVVELLNHSLVNSLVSTEANHAQRLETRDRLKRQQKRLKRKRGSKGSIHVFVMEEYTKRLQKEEAGILKVQEGIESLKRAIVLMDELEFEDLVATPTSEIYEIHWQFSNPRY